MRKRLLIVGLSVALFINAVLVLFKPARSRPKVADTYTNYSKDELSSVATSTSCNCTAQNSAEVELSPRPRPTANYSMMATEIPEIGTYTGRETFTRLGSQLKLDYSQKCPKGSLILDNEWRNSTPEHLDCPTLFIIGARKGGTTSLYTYLSRHPKFEGIYLDRGPSAGETFYFSAHYGKSDWEWSRYIGLFEQVKWYMTGDSSVGNLINCKVPGRIWSSCGKQAKIIILLRDPVNRFLSNLLMRIHQRIRYYNINTKASTVVEVELENFISAALDKGVNIASIEQSWERFSCLFNPSRNLIFEGLYYVHVLNWLCNFPPENILIINSEEFFNNTAVIYGQVLQFLGLTPLDHGTVKFITSSVYNRGTGPTHSRQYLNDLDRNKLMAIFKYSNKPLLQLLDWENTEWNEK